MVTIKRKGVKSAATTERTTVRPLSLDAVSTAAFAARIAAGTAIGFLPSLYPIKVIIQPVSMMFIFDCVR